MNRQEDFSLARREGRRRTGKHIVLWVRSRGETPPRAARLGVVVGRKHGIAARRNLFKRRVRETFRVNKDRFARGCDFVVSPRIGNKDAFPASHRDLSAELLDLTGTGA